MSAPLIFRLEEASYLAGMVAGGLTRSNILGFMGGIELPPIKAAYQGWMNGAEAVNRRIRSREIYLNSFDDAAAGREAALALIRAGADMFHHNADAAAFGLFQAAKERAGYTCSARMPIRRGWRPGPGPWQCGDRSPACLPDGGFRGTNRAISAPRTRVFGLADGVVSLPVQSAAR